VGLVTSPTGAAVRDVLHVLGRRYAGIELVLAPCRVQGQGAELEIAAAIALLNRWSASDPGHRLDAILVTRGGGSLEDLWAFNEEAVARAIHASAVPVISAVGHEIDFTIGDFVADLRAATPSAAAEILTAGYVASRELVAGLAGRLARNLRAGLADAAGCVDSLRARLARAHPRRRLEERRSGSTISPSRWPGGRGRRCGRRGSGPTRRRAGWRPDDRTGAWSRCGRSSGGRRRTSRTRPHGRWPDGGNGSTGWRCG
jgi:exodeoxyribonuclease VII large subunit